MMRLQNEGYNIEYLLGNHETYMIDAWETDQKRHLFKSAAEREWEKHGGKNTLVRLF